MLSQKIQLLNQKVLDVNEKNEILMSKKAFTEAKIVETDVLDNRDIAEQLVRYSVKSGSPLSKFAKVFGNLTIQSSCTLGRSLIRSKKSGKCSLGSHS